MRRIILILFFLVFCGNFIFSQKAFIIDGDTMIIDNLKVRIQGIDSPELSQKFGKEAKKQLIILTKNKTLRIKIIKFDRYNRAICYIFANNKDVGLQMVQTGYAWAYRRYTNEYVFAEEKAKKRRIGIWQYNNNINPEIYRRL